MGALASRRPAGQGAVRRHLVVLGRARPARRRRILAGRGRAAAHPPAVLQPARTAGSSATCSMRWRRWVRAASPSRPLAQGLLTDKYLHGHPAGRAGQPPGRRLVRPRDARRGEPGAGPGAQRDRPAAAARASRRWRTRGSSATHASRPPSSAPARRHRSARTWGRWPTCSFSADELAEIDRHAVEGGVNLWEKPSTDQRI